MAENNSCPYSNDPEGKGITRRSFLGKLWWGAIGILGVQSLAAMVVSLKPKIAEGAFGTKVNIATLDEISAMPVGTVAYFRDQRVYISRLEGGVLALYRRCTHLGCVVPWVDDEPSEDSLASTGRFHCPCHGGIYDRYGMVHAGPPPRPMDLFKVTIDGENFVVDTGDIISRSKFEESQVTKV
jgi:cytochrome b6-f complex iron-sulfur subunit